MDSIYHTLEYTMSNDNETRKAAEEHLEKLAGTSGYLHGLLQVTTNMEIPYGPRLSAAIAFKRAVEKHWCYMDDRHRMAAQLSSPPIDGEGRGDEGRGEGRSRYSEEEKMEIRGQILGVAISQPTLPLINAFVDSITVIFRHDFPDRWEEFVPCISGYFTSGDSHTTLVSLLIFLAISKMFETDSVKARLVFKPVVEAIAPLLLQIAQFAAEHVNTEEGGHCLRLALKCFFSLSTGSFDVHQCLMDQDVFLAWCVVASKAMSKELPEPGEAGEPAGQPASADARERWIWWKVKKWGVKIFYRLAGEWGQPELIDDDAVKPIAALFNKVVAPEACKQLIEMFHAWQDHGKFISQKILFYGIHFLQSCLDFSSCWKSVLKHELPFIIQQVIFSLFKLTEDELAAIESDPYEYMRMSSESAFSSAAPRKSAELFLWAALEVRKATTAPVLDAMMRDGLALYESQAPAEKDHFLKEALLFLIQDLHNWLATDKVRKQFIEDMLVSHVTPELTSPLPFLRCRAVAVWAKYADIRFKNGDVVQHALASIYELLSDKVLVVKLTAGGSISAFLARSKRARKFMRPHMMDLLVHLFSMLDELGMDEVVRTIGVICDAYYDELPKMAAPLMEKLTTLWENSVEAAEDLDADEAESALFGDGLLSTMQTVIYQLIQSHETETLVAISPFVWRMCASLSKTEGPTLEYLDAAFEMYGDMLVALEDSITDIPEVWTLYLRMLHLYTECALDYTQCLLYPLDCLCVYAPDRMGCAADPTTGQDNALMLVKAAEFSEEHGDEDTRGPMTRIVFSLLHYCRGRIDRVIEPIVKIYAHCATSAHTKYLRSQAFTLIAGCLIYSPELTLAALHSLGLIESVFKAWIEGTAAEYYKKSLDCKISILGIANMLRSIPLATMPVELAAVVPQLIPVVCSLQIQYEKWLAREDKMREDANSLQDELDEEDELPDFRAQDEDDDPGSDYDFDETEDGEEELGGDIDDEADYVKESDRVHAAAAKARKEETDEQRNARLEELLEEGDVGERVPPKKTPLDHISHLLWLQEAVGIVMSQPGAEHLATAVDAGAQEILATLMARAGEMRAAGEEAGELGPA